MAHYSDDPDSKREGEEKQEKKGSGSGGEFFYVGVREEKKGLFRPIPTSGTEKEEEGEEEEKRWKIEEI